jgi:two-component system, NtrC family, sensor kinase
VQTSVFSTAGSGKEKREVAGMNILVVDDDRLTRAMLEKVITTTGNDAIMVNDGRQAWEYYRENVVPIVVTDWIMPEMDGLELCRRIRSADMGHYTYIVILSGKGDKDDMVRMLEAGADDFIAKPFSAKELMARIATGERIIRLENQHKELLSVIAESRDKMRTVFDALSEEIVTLDKHLEIVSANFAFVSARALNMQDVIGKPYDVFGSSLIGESGENLGTHAVAACFKVGRKSVHVVEVSDSGGRMHVNELRCLPVSSNSGETIQVILVVRDITEEREKNWEIQDLNQKLTLAIKQINQKNQTLEQTLQQLKESQFRVLQSEKMASIGQLAAGVAHEINNPTGYVSSNLKTLSDYQDGLLKVIPLYRQLVSGVKGGTFSGSGLTDLSALVDRIYEAEASEDIDFILNDMTSLISESREGTQRIKKIVNDLKEFSHPEADAKRETNLNDNIETTLNIVWNEIKYKAVVEKDFGDIPLLLCYPQRLDQVFLNILINAAHAIAANGTIRIQTRHVSGRIEITISDNGCGIPEENLARIFDPFFTTKAVGKGTGLGLHLAYNIISDHNGTIEVKSRVGEGTSFIIRLPVDAQTATIASGEK